jgi:propionyl-CoA carboxylase beta chain
MRTLEEKREHLSTLNKQAELGGGEARIEKQHAQGKYTARETYSKTCGPC